MFAFLSFQEWGGGGGGTGPDLGEGRRGCAPPPEMTCGFLIQLVFTSVHQSVTPFLSGAPSPKKKLGSAPGEGHDDIFHKE